MPDSGQFLYSHKFYFLRIKSVYHIDSNAGLFIRYPIICLLSVYCQRNIATSQMSHQLRLANVTRMYSTLLPGIVSVPVALPWTAINTSNYLFRHMSNDGSHDHCWWLVMVTVMRKSILKIDPDANPITRSNEDNSVLRCLLAAKSSHVPSSEE